MAHDSMGEFLAQSVARFETIGMPVRNLVLRTRREYTRDLRDFLAPLKRRNILLVATVRPADLKGYLAELDRRGLQGSTRNRKTHTLKTFFK